MSTKCRSATFDSARIAHLPDAARRYLRHSIREGAAIASTVTLSIDGSLRLSRAGKQLPMRSEEILSPRDGYLWRARIGRAPLVMRGFDSVDPQQAEMRWSLWGLVPIVRKKGSEVWRPAVGRLLGERIFVPTTLLPAEDVRWEEVDSHTANAHLSVHGESTVLTLEVDDEGRLQCASFPRWNSDPRIGPVGYNTFVSDTFSDERTFGDVTIPTRFRAGWRLGQPDEFPFFFGHIIRASFL